MSMITVLSFIYLVFMCYLYIKKNKFKNTYMIFGAITFLSVMTYCYIPNASQSIQKFLMFLSFSSFILNFGLMIGIISFIKSKSMKKSKVFSVVSSFLLIVMIFNIKGILGYIYIPVLLYALQEQINIMIKK